MLTQRWLFRRDTYRPAGETIRPSLYDVAPIDSDAVAKAFITTHHYAHSYPAARFRFGLYCRGALVGVCIPSIPVRAEVLTSVFNRPLGELTEIGRFVLLDEVPGNGETWFLARCFEQLRALDVRGVVSFSDPVPRETVDGRRIFPGHVGTIYQAHNGRYLGRGTARTLRVLPDGTVLSARALQKIRSGSQGWRYSCRLLERFGAPPAPEDLNERALWLSTWMRQLTRSMRHPGNHKYAWSLDRRLPVPESLVYPKR